MLQMAAQMGAALKDHGYKFSIEETHHASKLDAPSGTAISLKEQLALAGNHETPIMSSREGDETGLHLLVATSDSDRLTLKHETFNRLGFAEGAVRAAEWMATRNGVFDFRDVFATV
jgi:4-hydroxy-tetrahydrodipicolinate reductase